MFPDSFCLERYNIQTNKQPKIDRQQRYNIRTKKQQKQESRRYNIRDRPAAVAAMV